MAHWAAASTFAIVGSAGTINIGQDAAANTLVIGSTTGAAKLTLQAGTGATGLKLNAAGNVQMVPATSSTAAATNIDSAIESAHKNGVKTLVSAPDSVKELPSPPLQQASFRTPLRR